MPKYNDFDLDLQTASVKGSRDTIDTSGEGGDYSLTCPHICSVLLCWTEAPNCTYTDRTAHPVCG